MKNDPLFQKAYEGKKVLVTGSTGFKGSWMCIWLHQLGSEVHGLSLNDTDAEDNFQACSVDKIITQHYCDIRNKEQLFTIIQQIQPDVVFHLAAQALVIESYLNPLDTVETNVQGTCNVLEAIRKTESVQAAIMVTSDKCYWNREVVWGYREEDPLGGKDVYSASKAAAEIMIRAYTLSFFGDSKTRIASVRAGNVIGGGDWSENRLLSDIYRAKRAGETMEVRSPNSTRPWQHVLEPLFGYMVVAAELLGKDRDQYVGAWNFGPSTDIHYSVMRIIEKLNELGLELPVKDVSDHSTPFSKFKEANFLKLDISKSVNYLNWHPVLDFHETMKLTHEGYTAQLNGEDVYRNRIDQLDWFTKQAAKVLS